MYSLGSSEAAKLLATRIETLNKQCFPIVTVSYKSSDAPWVTKRTRRCVKARKKIFKREGKSDAWWSKKKESERLVKEAQKAYLETHRAKTVKAEGIKAYYRAAKVVGDSTKDNARWDLMDLFPGIPQDEALRRSVDYFSAVSNEFNPIVDRGPVQTLKTFHNYEPNQIAGMIRSSKKTSPTVPGDMPPEALSSHTIVLYLQQNLERRYMATRLEGRNSDDYPREENARKYLRNEESFLYSLCL